MGGLGLDFSVKIVYIISMSEITELWSMTWGDGFMLVAMLMGLYTYKVWVDNKFKK